MKIATKLVVAMFMFATIASVFGTTYSSGTIKSALQGNISKSQSLETVQVMDKIDRFLYERTLDLQILTERQQIVNYMQATKPNNPTDTKQLLSQFSDFRITTGVWGDMSLIDLNGSVRLASNSTQESLNDQARSQFKDTLDEARKGQITYSDVYTETDKNIPVMLFITPVRALSSGRPIIGFAAGELAWSTVLQILDHPGINVTSHLVNKEGFVLGSSAPNHNSDEILVNKISDSPIYKVATSGEEDETKSKVLNSIDNPEIKTLSTYEYERGYLNYKGNGWYMFYETPTAIAFAPATKLSRNMIISSMIITLVALAGVTWYCYRAVIKPVRKLRGAMYKIISGDRNSRVHVTSKDEIGELGLAFNQMSESLATSEKNLREEQARLSASVNSVEVGFIITDLQDNIVTINNSARELLSIAQEPTITVWDYKTVISVLRGSVDLPAVVKSCKETGHVLKIKEVNFSGKVLSLFAGPILSLTGKGEQAVIGTVILLEDITNDIIQARSKDEFFSIASHELRTPLTTIRGNSSMILQIYSDMLKDPSLNEMIVDIHDSSTRLIEIVNDFLDVSRIEQGKMKFTFNELKLDTIIEKIVYEMKAVLKEKQLSLDIEHKTLDALPSVIADSDRVKQIIYNLIGNAVKFTEKGGVKVSAMKEGSMVKVTVSDTGRGIPPDGQRMLFRKFQQASNSLLTRDTTKGTGLGLYISKLLVEGMGGKVALENSTEGKGSAFSFTLPIATTTTIAELQAKTEKQPLNIDADTGLTK